MRRLARIERPRSLLALDWRSPQARADFSASRKAEKQYAIRLRKIASHVEDIVRSTMTPEASLSAAVRIGRMLAQYSEALVPWAEAVTRRMHGEINARDTRQWSIYADEIGRELRREIETAPTGDIMRQLLAEQVTLITSLPTDAAERVHKLTVEGLTGGTRASSIVDEIMRTGEVTRSRATLIARTETARTASVLTQARAQHVGSTHFIWQTARDAQVRPSHRKLQGKTFRWDDPPECDPGHRALPGQIWNCRCFAQPVLSAD